MADFINTIDVLGDEAVIDGIITRTITEFRDDTITKVGAWAFYKCNLDIVDLPNVTEIGADAFEEATIKAINLPRVTTIGGSAFYGAKMPELLYLPAMKDVNGLGNSTYKHLSVPVAETIGGRACFHSRQLESVNAPMVTFVGYLAFQNCVSLKTIDFPMLNKIEESAFLNAASLNTVVLRNNAVCQLLYSNAFQGTPIASGAGYIYVPRALVDSYKSATNWSVYADRFRALEDYTVDGTTTGELDETKI